MHRSDLCSSTFTGDLLVETYSAYLTKKQSTRLTISFRVFTYLNLSCCARQLSGEIRKHCPGYGVGTFVVPCSGDIKPNKPKVLVEEPNHPTYTWARWQYPSRRTTINRTVTNELMPHRLSRGAQTDLLRTAGRTPNLIGTYYSQSFKVTGALLVERQTQLYFSTGCLRNTKHGRSSDTYDFWWTLQYTWRNCQMSCEKKDLREVWCIQKAEVLDWNQRIPNAVLRKRFFGESERGSLKEWIQSCKLSWLSCATHAELPYTEKDIDFRAGFRVDT
ncbi:hypothetical protein CLF_112423 [Clonorchis sinensis]|uniref:Uncharacterized protein n=1 Tax=Clonorchis sinensis TaxID=79923 RepID=G7YMH3_CLOSI|nr:hypothetical protein CLF_112423 [Clonorchis sinensis]